MADSASSEKSFPNRLSKIKQRVCNLIFDILSELCVQILKNHENKPKRPLPCFHVPYKPYFKWNAPFTKVIQKWSLTQAKTLHSLWNCKNCIRMGKTQKRVVWEAKHKPCMFGIIIRSWLSNMWCVARLGTICTICKKFYHYITILPPYYQCCYYKILRLCITIILLLC